MKKEYQGKGFMRPLVETAFEVAGQGNLPVTDLTVGGLDRKPSDIEILILSEPKPSVRVATAVILIL